MTIYRLKRLLSTDKMYNVMLYMSIFKATLAEVCSCSNVSVYYHQAKEKVTQQVIHSTWKLRYKEDKTKAKRSVTQEKTVQHQTHACMLIFQLLTHQPPQTC